MANSNASDNAPVFEPEPAPAPDLITVPEEPAAAPLKTTADGTPQRLSSDAPLTNEQVRNPGPGIAYPEQYRAHLDDATERLRRQTIAESGVDPADPAQGSVIDHHVYTDVEVPANPEERRPGAFYGQSTTYVYGERDIFASSVGQVITSYTLDSSAVTADANGDKIVYEGTTLQASGAKVAPRTSGTSVGVLANRVNVRLSDAEIGMVIGGRLNGNKLWDNGVFGMPSGTIITQLAAVGIIVQAYDA